MASLLRRLWRPRHPLFWLFVVFNGLSSAAAWAMRAVPEGSPAFWMLALLALGNVAAGLVVGARLLRTP